MQWQIAEAKQADFPPKSRYQQIWHIAARPSIKPNFNDRRVDTAQHDDARRRERWAVPTLPSPAVGQHGILRQHQDAVKHFEVFAHDAIELLRIAYHLRPAPTWQFLSTMAPSITAPSPMPMGGRPALRSADSWAGVS